MRYSFFKAGTLTYLWPYSVAFLFCPSCLKLFNSTKSWLKIRNLGFEKFCIDQNYIRIIKELSKDKGLNPSHYHFELRVNNTLLWCCKEYHYIKEGNAKQTAF